MITKVLSRAVASCLVVLTLSLAAYAGPEEILLELAQDVGNYTYGEIDSLLIWHDEELLVEEYYRGHTANTLHRMYSTTKSVTSALVGIAIENGAIEGVESRLLDYFPDYTPANLDARKEVITLEHMLKMQAGFAWDETSYPYGSDLNSVTQLENTDQNWMEYIVDQEMSSAPGEEFTYNSGVSILLSRVLSESVGTTARAFAEQTLFADLDIDTIFWGRTAQGESNTGWGLWLRPLDMLKFGQLYVNDGYWQPEDGSPGMQVVPSEWIDASLQPYVEGGMTDSAGNLLVNYGYQWWLFQDDAPQVSELAVNDVAFTWGYGGQFIVIVPHLDLVVATTAHNYDSSFETKLIELALQDYVFPAIQQMIELRADFDDDGDIDGADFLAWQRGESPNPFSHEDLDDWQSTFGTVAPPTATSTAVPEPATWLMLILGMAAMLFRRRMFVS